MLSLDVRPNDVAYPVYIGKDVTSRLGKMLKKMISAERVAVITDRNVNALYGEKVLNILNSEGFDAMPIVVAAGEESKSLDILQNVYHSLLECGITRWDAILTLGGGVVGDLGGFAAATFLRGVPYIQVPTSLLAQIDSSIGGKVAVDLPEGKNLVGSFYHPRAVFVDPNFLDTLPARYFNDGMAEVIKYGCIGDADFFKSLEAYKTRDGLLDNIDRVIFTCLDIKRAVVEEDHLDQGKRMILNFGHTLGHAIENYFNYGTYTHGEGVAIGMYQITKNSEYMGITKAGTAARVKKILAQYSLPYEMPPGDIGEIIRAIGVDKKSKGRDINIVLLEETGKSLIKQVSQREIYNYYAREQ